jgi:hypothetical protein
MAVFYPLILAFHFLLTAPQRGGRDSILKYVPFLHTPSFEHHNKTTVTLYPDPGFSGGIHGFFSIRIVVGGH